MHCNFKPPDAVPVLTPDPL